MTEQNLIPDDADDTEGHKTLAYDVEQDADDGDDTEGHVGRAD